MVSNPERMNVLLGHPITHKDSIWLSILCAGGFTVLLLYAGSVTIAHWVSLACWVWLWSSRTLFMLLFSSSLASSLFGSSSLLDSKTNCRCYRLYHDNWDFFADFLFGASWNTDLTDSTDFRGFRWRVGTRSVTDLTDFRGFQHCRATSYELRATNYELRITSYEINKKRTAALLSFH